MNPGLYLPEEGECGDLNCPTQSADPSRFHIGGQYGTGRVKTDLPKDNINININGEAPEKIRKGENNISIK